MEHKKITSIICFTLLMFIDRVVGTESQFIWLITNNLVGIAFSLIIISSFGFRGFLKPFYIICSAAGIISVIGGYAFWYTHQVGHIMGYWITVPLNIWILGSLFFKFIERIFITKDLKLCIEKWEIVFSICMLLMLLSRNESVWPLYYMIIFLMLWHCPLSADDKRKVFLGAIDGIILGFFLLQTYAFVSTRYITPRYYGAYGDCNRNSCMYLIALSAVLAKSVIYGKTQADRKRKFDGFGYLILSGVICALIMYTGCRSALAGMFFILVIYLLIASRRYLSLKWSGITCRFAVILASVIISIPVLYFPMRYLPEASRHLFSVIRGNESEFLENNSTYDYVTFDEVIGNTLFRAFRSDLADESTVFEHSHTTASLHRSKSKSDYYTVYYSFREYPEKGTFSFKVSSKMYSGMRSLNHRINIYIVLLRNMNIAGHTTEEMYIDIESDVPGAEIVHLYNAQNFVINYLYAYGVPVGLLICALMIAELVMIIRKVMAKRIDGLLFLMIAVAHICMGLMEVVWIPGQLILILLFVAPLFLNDMEFEFS